MFGEWIHSARVNKIHCRNTSDRNDCEWQQSKGKKGAKKEEDEDRGRILNKIKRLSDAEMVLKRTLIMTKSYVIIHVGTVCKCRGVGRKRFITITK